MVVVIGLSRLLFGLTGCEGFCEENYCGVGKAAILSLGQFPKLFLELGVCDDLDGDRHCRDSLPELIGIVKTYFKLFTGKCK